MFHFGTVKVLIVWLGWLKGIIAERHFFPLYHPLLLMLQPNFFRISHCFFSHTHDSSSSYFYTLFFLMMMILLTSNESTTFLSRAFTQKATSNEY
jgi:hypothetical protein